MKMLDQSGGNPQLEAVIQQIDAQGITALRSHLRSKGVFGTLLYWKINHWVWLVSPKLQKLFPAPVDDRRERENVLCLLWKSGLKAEPAIPELTSALRDPRSTDRSREFAARALSGLGPKAQSAIPALTRSLNDPSETVIECAARALGTIGPAAKSSLPALEAKIGQRRDYLTVAIAEAIWRIDPDRSGEVNLALKESIKDVNAYSRVYGSKVLWEVSKDSATTVPVLMGVIADANLISIHQWSIKLLGEMGPAASNAVPLLKAKADAGAAVLDNTTKEFREAIQKAAREALSKITNAP